MTATEALVLHTSDGVALEAQYAPPVDETRGSVVLCHPHPQYGGTMRSIVVSALFEQLPDAGYGCVRFNFRGVEGSAGAHAGGELETEDVRAALEYAAGLRLSGPLALAGWSFGADMALSVIDARLGGWVGIAPPLRFGKAFDPVAHDPRPKHLVLAQHDEFRDPSDVETEVASWTRASTEIVPGASHFFIGRTDRVVAATLTFLASLPRS
ncbi:MAG: alpha/beta hydrolase [Acidimicrobiia bacterium]